MVKTFEFMLIGLVNKTWLSSLILAKVDRLVNKFDQTV
jgi:hypothetical protein